MRLVLLYGSVYFPAADLLSMILSTEEPNFDTSRRAVVLKLDRDAANNSFLTAADVPQP